MGNLFRPNQTSFKVTSLSNDRVFFFQRNCIVFIGGLMWPVAKPNPAPVTSYLHVQFINPFDHSRRPQTSPGIYKLIIELKIFLAQTNDYW